MITMAGDLQFTLREAATLLPPFDEQRLQAIVRALGWEPSGSRRTGQPGHPAATYDAAELFRLHAALLPFTRAS